MGNETHFATDLYQGTAGYYDRYRLPYPTSLLTHLVASAHLPGHGRLLGLACGTGQLAFPLSPHFAEAWAVDQEPDMIETVRAKSTADGMSDLRPIIASAEMLDAQPNHFELAVVGNAFHRLERDLVARRIFHWLTPGRDGIAAFLRCNAQPGSGSDARNDRRGKRWVTLSSRLRG